jgi:hypothetical protein
VVVPIRQPRCGGMRSECAGHLFSTARPFWVFRYSLRWMTWAGAAEWPCGGAAFDLRGSTPHLGRTPGGAGFSVLPTFGRPHTTVLLDSLDQTDQLFDLLGPPQPNAGYGEPRRRRRSEKR